MSTTPKATTISIYLFLTMLILLMGCAPIYTENQTPLVPAEKAMPAAPTDPASPDREPYAGAVFWPGTQETAMQPGCATVNATQALNMRAGPGTEQAVIKYLYFGDQVEILDASSKPAGTPGWWKIRAGAMVGWVNARYLQEGCEP